MSKIFLLIISSVAYLFSQSIQLPLNTTLYGSLKPRTGSYASCYGYVAPNGKEYAIIGNQNGTSIIDINSQPITEVAFIPGPSSLWKEMKVYQNYCYVVTENRSSAGYGLQIINLSNLPTSATLVKTILPTFLNNTTQQKDTVVSSHSISIEGKTLYLNGSSKSRSPNFTGGVIALDLTDPENPTPLGMYQGVYVHDSAIYNDTIYAAAIYSGGGIEIIDARDKFNMKRIAKVSYPFSGTHNVDLTSDKKFILSTDEIGSENILRIWDRTNIMDVKLAAKYRPSKYSRSHNAHVRGDYAYVAYYTQGLRIVDLKDPNIPVEVGNYDTHSLDTTIYDGVWGVFPNFPSGKIILSDMSNGLYVIEFPGTLSPSTIKVARSFLTIADSTSGLPIPNVTVEIPNNPNIFITNSVGKVGIGGLYDTMTVKITPSGNSYKAIYQKLNLTLGATVNITIKLPKIINSVDDEKVIATTHFLAQNYPNPFNPSTTINYYLSTSEFVTLKVYDILGKEISTLVNSQIYAGSHSVEFKSNNLPSGVYYYILNAGNQSLTKRMILSK
ncbi:MAG: choice-of-anchor B family protein [Bacteroidetes bacterium]|nr:choice-of-anchor B family protein [Bacteroidota bacterium]